MIIMIVQDKFNITGRVVQVITGTILYNDSDTGSRKIPKDAVIGIIKRKLPISREIMMGREEPSFFGVNGHVGICLHEDVEIEIGDIITYPPLG